MSRRKEWSSAHGHRKSNLLNTFWVILIGLALVSCQGTLASLRNPSANAKPTDTTKEERKAEIVKNIYRLQMPFIANEGQIQDENVRFYAKTFAGTVYVTEQGEMVYSLPHSPNPKSEIPARHRPPEANSGEAGGRNPKFQVSILKETLVDASSLAPSGTDPAQTKVNYFIGNDRNKWKTNISTYNSVNLGEVYKGINLSLKAYGKTMEKVFTVEPGADPKAIKLKMEGANSLKVNEQGELEMETDFGVVQFSRPVAYQKKNGKKENVQVAYNLDKDNYGFKAGTYDKSLPLIIDPMLSYSTYLGGGGDDGGYGIAVDGSGNAYVTGETGSAVATGGFPTQNPFQADNAGG